MAQAAMAQWQEQLSRQRRALSTLAAVCIEQPASAPTWHHGASEHIVSEFVHRVNGSCREPEITEEDDEGKVKAG